MVSYCSLRLGASEAEDAAAEAFTKVWERKRQFDPKRGELQQWLWGIVRNAVADRYRKWSRAGSQIESAQVGHQSIESGTGAGPMPEQSDSAGNALEAQAGARLELARVVEAMRGLPSVDQEIIALRFGGGLSNKEIAEVVGRSEGNVAVRLHRAFRRLRLDLEGSGGQ